MTIKVYNMDNNKIKYTLPRGWIWTTLDMVSKNITDGSHNPPSKQSSGIPMLSARNIENGKITFDEVRYISESDYEYENQRARIEAGDVLLTIVATIGRSAIIPTPIQQRFALQRSVAIIKPLIEGHFLMYVLQAPEFQKLLNDNAKGTAQKGVYLKTLRELPIPLPPIAEQYRIVAKIEELFSELDHAETGLKKANKQLEIYRQALLKNAFEGKLTEKWRKVNDSFKNNDWVHITIGECSKFIGSGSTPKGGRSIYLSEGIPFIRSQNIHVNSFLQNDLVFISKETNEKMSRTKTQPFDVLLNITGASIGRCAYIPSNLPEGNINQHVCIIRVDPKKIFYKFLTYYLNSPEAQTIISRINSGATREALTLSQINKLVLPFCEWEEQYQIVQELESKFTFIENIENSIYLSFQRIRILRQSILKKAFRGKLLNQNINDEPAKKLFERIIKGKANYLEKSIRNSAPKNKAMKKRTLSEILSENFVNKEFSFDEIRNKTFFSYEELKGELYKLLDEGKSIETFFDEKLQKIQFKLKS